MINPHTFQKEDLLAAQTLLFKAMEFAIASHLTGDPKLNSQVGEHEIAVVVEIDTLRFWAKGATFSEAFDKCRTEIDKSMPARRSDRVTITLRMPQ